MAETPPSSSSPPSGRRTHWCYNCTSHVSVENPSPDLPDVICSSCKGGFVVESAPSSSSSPPPSRAPMTPPQDSSSFDSDDDGDDFLRIEFDGWGNEADGGDEEYASAYFDEMESVRGRDVDQQPQEAGEIFGRRASVAEMMRDLRDSLIQLRVDIPEEFFGIPESDESDGYFGNPEDYVDAAGFEGLLQNLVENDGGARRGAPPAARSAVAGLPTVVIGEDESLRCAICKERMRAGEEGKKLPCKHVYHGDCIVPWLESRNSCPVCRFELPTDDVEYEQGRKTRPDFTRNNAI